MNRSLIAITVFLVLMVPSISRKEENTDLASSGVQWFASLFVILIIGLFVFGAKRRKRLLGR